MKLISTLSTFDIPSGGMKFTLKLYLSEGRIKSIYPMLPSIDFICCVFTEVVEMMPVCAFALADMIMVIKIRTAKTILTILSIYPLYKNVI
jgi:hypothetical protein